MRLLIVDDSVQMRQLLRAMLRSVADDIIECSNGHDAIRCYFDVHPDWVLMDIRMEPVDGLTATREIKRRDPDARIIVLSQYDDDEIQAEVSAAGAVAYVHKENLLAIRKLMV